MNPAIHPAPKKYFGQHFLTSSSYAERIAAAIPAQPSQAVLEIGGGRGALSVHIQKRFPQFHCLEKDRDLIPLLTEALGTGRHTIHEGDVLDFDFSMAGQPLHVAGNLPYSIGAMIIHKALNAFPQVASCTFMVQREVAERICAQPDNKTYGYLSVFCRYFGIPRYLFTVPAGAFSPRPKIDSAVFQIVIDPAAANLISSELRPSFFALVSLGFSQRRKMLASILRARLGIDAVALQKGARIAPTARAENVDIREWQALFGALQNAGITIEPRKLHLSPNPETGSANP